MLEQDSQNCLFDSIMFFFSLKPPNFKGSNLRLLLISTMALNPDVYKVNKYLQNKLNTTNIRNLNKQLFT